MRTAQMLLLTFTFLVLTSDVVTKASIEGSIRPDLCTSTIISANTPCDTQDCLKRCQKQVHGSGQCVSEGCKCTFCIFAPSVQNNEEKGSN
uniref:Uncharacterized protein n=1 Tax=Avena sativa TaxID=4498 RepID=A0ACD6AL79_AVESA